MKTVNSRHAAAHPDQAGTDHSRRQRMALVALGIVLTAGAVLCLNQILPSSFETDIGQRQAVALVGGSRIFMDAGTRVQVAYYRSAPSIILELGRSHFDVPHGSTQPLIVTAGAQTVWATGTSFDVERFPSRVLVTPIQGQLLIQRQKSGLDTPYIVLQAGEQLIADTYLRPVVTAVVPQERTWQAGILLFREERLANAVARINRYTTHPIRIDPSIAEVHISGTFKAGDVGSFIRAVTSQVNVRASTNPDHTIQLQRRS